MIITGQQKIRLKKWERGELKNTDLYKFLASRINEIPNNIISNGTDEDAINYCINNSIVKTNPNKSINFYSKLKHSRLENRKRLKNKGII